MMRDDLKIPLTMLSIGFLNKLPYKGSYNGKRFMFKKELNADKFILKVYVWKDLFNFENTDKSEIKTKEFDFTKQGIEQGIDFVEEMEIK